MLFKLSSVLLLLAAPGALAGLEDAKFSTALNKDNFKSFIGGQTKGSLVAFFAPWCGHCKSLEPTWTKVAEAFDGDDRCKLGHFDADNADNRPIATSYGVSGYPTIKFIQANGKAVDYQSPRTESALLEFLNEHCGTHRLPGGALGNMAGRIPSLDEVAQQYFGPSANKKTLYESASDAASKLAKDGGSTADYYLKVMKRFVDDVEGAGPAWVKQELARLNKLASKRGAIAGRKFDELRMKQNVLGAFEYVKGAAEGGYEAAADAAGSVVQRVKAEL